MIEIGNIVLLQLLHPHYMHIAPFKELVLSIKDIENFIIYYIYEISSKSQCCFYHDNNSESQGCFYYDKIRNIYYAGKPNAYDSPYRREYDLISVKVIND